jgi:hypothetical protein
MPWAVAGAVAGAYITSEGAKDAADTQAASADKGVAENRRQFDFMQQLMTPYIDAGRRGLTNYEVLAGTMGDSFQRGAIKSLADSPQFTSLAKQGENAILQNASATGGLRGGNTQAALAGFRENLLSKLIDQQLSRYGSLAQSGQNSAAGVGTAGMTMGANNAQLMQQAGAAQAGGIVAGTNAITGAVGNIGGILAGRGTGTPTVGAGYTVGDSTVLPTGDFARMDRAF